MAKILLWFTIVTVILVKSDGFTVLGSSAPLVAPLGSSVILPCFMDEPFSVKGLKVEWTRTDSNNLVHLFIHGKSRAEEQHKDYYQRAHFITEEIQHGVFSLRLDDLRAEDKGLYRCKVYSQRDAGQTVVQIKYVEYLSVSGSAGPVSASVGEDVTLSCSVKSHVPPEEIERVSWRKTDEDLQLMLFEKSAVIPADERYRERVEFFSSEIPKGNFSVRLRSVGTEDAGVYMCHVKTGGVSANTTVIIETHHLSDFHTLILLLCVAASGSALLFCFLIYCRSQTKSTVRRLQYCLIFLPNITMCIAVILWGVSEGSVNETVACSVLYFLRPNMLFRSQTFSSNQWMNYRVWSFLQYIAFTVIVYQGLLSSGWEQNRNSEKNLLSMICVWGLLAVLPIFGFLTTIFPGMQRIHMIIHIISALKCMDTLPIVFFISTFYHFGAALFDTKVLLATGVLPLFISVTRYNLEDFSLNHVSRMETHKLYDLKFRQLCPINMKAFLLKRRDWILDVTLVNAVMIWFYSVVLENQRDYMEWAFVIGFLQIQWAFMDLSWAYDDSVDCHNMLVHLIGSVGVVLLNSFTLMTEVMLKTLTGERRVGDLRIILFPSESCFALFLLILQLLAPGETHVHKGCNYPVVILLFILLSVVLLVVKGFI